MRGNVQNGPNLRIFLAAFPAGVYQMESPKKFLHVHPEWKND